MTAFLLVLTLLAVVLLAARSEHRFARVLRKLKMAQSDIDTLTSEVAAARAQLAAINFPAAGTSAEDLTALQAQVSGLGDDVTALAAKFPPSGTAG